MTTTPFDPFASPHVRTYANRADWLADRTARAPDGHPSIGASDIGSIFGCGFRSPAETAMIMRGIAPREEDSTDPMNPLNVGSRLEAVALGEYCLINEIGNGKSYMEGCIMRWTHPAHLWLSVSPDALIVEDRAVIGAVECKIPRGAWALNDYAPELPTPDGYSLAATLADPDGPAVPRGYALQVLTQLGVMRACGATLMWCDVWVWPSPHEHRRVRLLWDDATQAAFDALITAVEEWRTRHVIEGQDHPITCADAAAVIVRHWGHEGQHEAPGLAATAARYTDLGARIKALQAEQDAAKAILIDAARAAGADRIIVPDPAANPLASRKAEREGKPCKITISRGLRVTPGWLADAAPAHLADDIAAPIEPIHVPGVTVGELAARWADAPTAPATDAPQAADPILAAALAAMASDDGADW
jgi:hypothetical protein